MISDTYAAIENKRKNRVFLRTCKALKVCI